VDCSLIDAQLTRAKIDGQAQASKKVQPQQSIDSTARRQGMAEYLKTIARLPEGD
jgi:hypothetical protein